MTTDAKPPTKKSRIEKTIHPSRPEGRTMTADTEFPTTNPPVGDAIYLERPDGRIAYEVVGHGPLVVLSPGVADIRSSYRFLAPLIADAGYRVASVDLRGHGESSTGWGSYSRADTAGDLIEVVRKLGGPAVIVGQSFSGGSATIAAATNPDLVSAIVEIDPFTRAPKFSVAALLRDAQYRRGALLLGEFVLTGSVRIWSKYLDVAYPGRKPADWDSWLAALQANLREPGRVKAAQGMFKSKPVDAAAQLDNVRCPALVVMGSDDSDFPDPEAEAAAIVGLLPDGLGRYEMIEHAGHYPHAQYPQQVANALLPFLAEHTHA
ncbi:MAG TPA: alpha/beta hydrolase [Solirubrobacteraceae bacterium]|nr:alpha/beta hydrolase [Solirubrobacteraceae bacterium]